MPDIGLDTSEIIKLSQSKSGGVASVAFVATDLVDGIEIQFQTYVGVTYRIEYSPDMVTWSLLPTVYEGDGTIQSASISSTHPRLYFRMRESFYESSEPWHLQAIAAWDGSYILLEWVKFTSIPSSPTAHWRITKDGQQLTTVPVTAIGYKDLAPSPSPHTYSVGYYN